MSTVLLLYIPVKPFNPGPAGKVDTSHQRWVLDMKSLVSPGAIICADLQLEVRAGRHFVQSEAQHQRILAVLEAIGAGSDGSDNDSDSSRDTHEGGVGGGSEGEDGPAAATGPALQTEGRAAEQGMGSAASKRARLHASAEVRRKARPPPQKQQPNPLARRQVGRQLAGQGRCRGWAHLLGVSQRSPDWRGAGDCSLSVSAVHSTELRPAQSGDFFARMMWAHQSCIGNGADDTEAGGFRQPGQQWGAEARQLCFWTGRPAGGQARATAAPHAGAP